MALPHIAIMFQHVPLCASRGLQAERQALVVRRRAAVEHHKAVVQQVCGVDKSGIPDIGYFKSGKT
jgi:hypothetical protein